jgi:hypothetical protein
LLKDGYDDAKSELENRLRAELEKVRIDVYPDAGQRP